MKPYTILNTTPTESSFDEFVRTLSEITTLEKLDEHLKGLVTAAVDNLKAYFGYEPTEKLMGLIA